MSSLKRRKDEKQRDFKNKNEQQTVTPDPTRPIHVENTTRPSSPRLLIIASCFLLHPSSSCPKPKASVIIAKKSTLSAFNMASTDSEEAQSVNKQYEENIAAQRSAAEAIAISRATLEATMGQGEQLQNCEKLQERNKYVVQKSGRMVRGMTWSGWMMNVFSKDVEPPMDRAASDAMKQSSSSDDAVSHILGDSDVKDVPEELENPARMLQNYECNVILLEKCQTRQEFNTLLEICKSLNTSARRSLMDREGPGRLSGRSFQLLRKLEKRFEQVEDLQFSTVQKLTEKFQGETQANVQTQRRDDSLRSSSSKPTCNPSKERLWAKTNDTTLKHRIEKQDEHLDILAGNIQELLHNGASIGTSLEQQNRLLEKLDEGTEDLTEQTKMVTRRADRLSHRSVSSTNTTFIHVQSTTRCTSTLNLYSSLQCVLCVAVALTEIRL